MSEPEGKVSVDENAEKTEDLVGRREAIGRFAKYTAPAMLAVLMSTKSATACVSNCGVISDIRLKRDIARVGDAGGIGLYRFQYLWSDAIHVGVIAQEVASVMPEAVQRGTDGYLRVDYARLGVQMQTWDQWVAAQ
jgi:hypothetical protein